MKTFAVLILLAGGFCANLGSPFGATRHLVGGSDVDVRSISDFGYTFRLTFDAGPKWNLDDSSDWGRIGPDGPSVRLTRLTGKLHGERLLMQESCYAGLYDVRSLKLLKAKRGVRLLLKGGDAGSAYTAEIRFDGLNLTERTVRNGEFADQLFERTQYHWVTETTERFDRKSMPDVAERFAQVQRRAG